MGDAALKESTNNTRTTGRRPFTEHPLLFSEKSSLTLLLFVLFTFSYLLLQKSAQV